MSEWISVVKKYPARYEKVLGYVQKLGMSPYCTTVTFMDLSDKYFVDSYGNEVHSVSHWMPLPNPPEQQEERTLDNCSLFNNPWSKPKQKKYKVFNCQRRKKMCFRVVCGKGCKSIYCLLVDKR